MKNYVILHEGPVAFVRKTGECYEIIVFKLFDSRPAGITDDGEKAKRICDRLNADPEQTLKSYGICP